MRDDACHVYSDLICELLEERATLERILGSASKRDRVEKDQKRAKLSAMLDAIKNRQTEMLAGLELLRKDDAKVALPRVSLRQCCSQDQL